jgi:hypothetical protein
MPLDNVFFTDIHDLNSNNYVHIESRSCNLEIEFISTLLQYISEGYRIIDVVNYKSVGLYVTTLVSSQTDLHITLKLCTNGVK